MDDPETILKGALENHYQMVKQFKGECLKVQVALHYVGAMFLKKRHITYIYYKIQYLQMCL